MEKNPELPEFDRILRKIYLRFEQFAAIRASQVGNGTVVFIIMRRQLANRDKLVANPANVKFSAPGRGHGCQLGIRVVVIVLDHEHGGVDRVGRHGGHCRLGLSLPALKS